MTSARNDLAINGGPPVRGSILPYARQSIDEDDIRAVVEVLRSDWLTTGPKVPEFEQSLATFLHAGDAVAVSNGTAALHAAMFACAIGPGDEVILPAMTFVATLNAVLYQDGVPVFVDVDPDTLLVDVNQVKEKICPKTKAIIAVDYAGQPCDYAALNDIARRHGLALVADASHALGAEYDGRMVGSLADLTVFSFHPAKHITTGEGGVIATDNPEYASALRRFRNHGIATDHHQRAKAGSWHYDIIHSGYNYRLTDIQCALGTSQLRKLPQWLKRRREIAGLYDTGFAQIPAVAPLVTRDYANHAYHLYVVRLDLNHLEASRTEIFTALRAEGIGVNVHYIPAHLHPFHRQQLGTQPGLCPQAENAYERILSLPLWPGMSDEDVQDSIDSVRKVLDVYRG